MSAKRNCRTKATPKSQGITEGGDAFWHSALGPIACHIDRITYDEDKRCWNATVTLTEDLDWHKAGKSLATHVEKFTPTRENSRPR